MEDKNPFKRSYYVNSTSRNYKVIGNQYDLLIISDVLSEYGDIIFEEPLVLSSKTYYKVFKGNDCNIYAETNNGIVKVNGYSPVTLIIKTKQTARKIYNL